MSRNIFRWIAVIITSITIASLLFIIWLSFATANETKGWNFFNFDFANKHNTISAYVGFLSAILAFITVLLILLDLLYQRRLKQRELEENESNKIQQYIERAETLVLFIDRAINSILVNGIGMTEFANETLEFPARIKMIRFKIITFPALIRESDIDFTYQVFRYFKKGEDWKMSYVDLYEMIDFYNQTFPIFMQDHHERFLELTNKDSTIVLIIDDFISKIVQARNKYLRVSEDELKELKKNPNVAFILFNKYKEIIEKIITKSTLEFKEKKRNVDTNSYIEWRDQILIPFIDDFQNLSGEEKINDQDLGNISLIARNALREIDNFVRGNITYSSSLTSLVKDFYNEKAKSIGTLKRIRNELQQIK